MPAEDGIMSLLVWLSLTHPLPFTNDFNNSGYFAHEKKRNIVKILRLGYTLKIKVLQSTNSWFSPATHNQLKIIEKLDQNILKRMGWIKYFKIWNKHITISLKLRCC